MKTRYSRTTGGVLATAVIASALVLAPQASTAAPLQAEDAAAGCEVTGGTLGWGVKESFRSYISGTIANGSWETSDGAEYETPNFSWSDATGSFDPETGTGTVSFVGTVHFTGHDGVLDLTLANPTIEFEGEGTAALLLDAKSTDMEGEVAVDAEQEWVGDIELLEDPAVADGVLEVSEAPVLLTNSGVSAFAGFYEAGDELDPLVLSVELAGCETTAPVDSAQESEEATPIAAPDEAVIPWLPIIVGGAALFVIGLTLGLIIGGRGKRHGAAYASEAASAPGTPGAPGASGAETTRIPEHLVQDSESDPKG